MRDSKICMLKGVPTTPVVFAAWLLEQSENIEHIAAVIQWKKEQVTNVAHTTMSNSERAWMAAVFNDEFKIFQY